MGIEIILYDSSPVTQKIFFHILYHYRPIVHRIDQTSKLIEKVQYSVPDIIFIDAAFSNDIKNQINEKKEKFKNIPIILIAKTDLNQEELESSIVKGVLKKPIEAGKLRKLVNHFIPKTKRNILTEHLKFSPIPDFKEEENPEQSSDFSSKTTMKQAEYKQELPKDDTDDIYKSPDQNQHHDKKTIQPIPMKESSEQDHVSLPKTSTTSNQSDGEINPVIDTQALNEKKDSSPAEETSNQLPEDAINPVTATESRQQPEDSSPQAEETKQSSWEDAIKPVATSTQLHQQEEPNPPEQESHPPTENIDNTKKKSATDVKIVQISSGSKLENKDESPAEPDNINSKKQITEDIKLWANKIIKEEVEKQLERIIRENSQNTIQTITEKVVWQVVPELAKQLVTKELDKILKEEGDPESSNTNEE